jgi:hypothetical protein
MDERRRFVRLPARWPVECVVLPETRSQRLVTKDVGGGGMRLFGERAMAPGTQLQLAVHAPGREAPVNVLGVVVWSEAQQTNDQLERQRSVEIGVRAAEIAPQDQEILMQGVRLGLVAPVM